MKTVHRGKKKEDCLQALLNMCRLHKWKDFQYERSQAPLFKIVNSFTEVFT